MGSNAIKKGLLISIGIFFLSSVGAFAGQEIDINIPKKTSTGTIFIVDPVGHYVMIQKENGKKVSLELTQETRVSLNGKKLSLDGLSELKKGFSATAEHFTNDAGMQQTVWLKVKGGLDND